MKKLLFTIGLIYGCLLQITAQESSSQIPKLVKKGSSFQLLADNKPFLIFGRHVRIPGNEYTIQQIKLYTY